MQSVEIQQSGPLILTGVEFERAANQRSICLSTRHRQKQRACFHKACCLPTSFFFLSFFVVVCVPSPIKDAVGGFIYRRAAAAGRCRLNVLLMEQIMSKAGFFSALSPRMKGKRREGR